MTADVAEKHLSFIELFLGTLVSPVSTFAACRNACQSKAAYVPETFALVIGIFALGGIRMSQLDSMGWAPLNIAIDVSTGLTVWLTAFGLLALTAACFNQEAGKIRSCLVTIGLSLTPWLLMGPISCLRGALGPLFIVLALLPAAWVFFLQIIAINQSFNMKSWQSICLALIVPSLLSSLQITQFFQILTVVLGSV